MDPAALISAIADSLRLLLNEVRRRGRSEAAEIYNALIALEFATMNWVVEARDTDRAARAWASARAEGLDNRTWRLKEQLVSQPMSIAVFRDMLFLEVRGKGKQTLEDLLRVHAPLVYNSTPLLAARHRLLSDGLEEALEERWQRGGQHAVETYLDEMERAREGLEQFRADLAAFIAQEFPLRP